MLINVNNAKTEGLCYLNKAQQDLDSQLIFLCFLFPYSR